MSTNGAPETGTGFYEFSTLPDADNEYLTPYFITGWAGMSVLLVDTEEGRVRYLSSNESLSCFASNSDTNQPLRRLEHALQQDTHPPHLALHSLSTQVGQIADPERKSKVQKWERDFILERRARLNDTQLSTPKKGWGKKDYVRYHAEIRAVEREDLLKQVADMAGSIAMYNETHQLYVARQSRLRDDRGWFAPLVGLTVDTNTDNHFSDQVHDVVPVIKQTDETLARLKGAASGIYTKYAPLPRGFGSA